MAHPLSYLDLTVEQCEAIERDIGLPLTKWDDAPSRADLLVRILLAVKGGDEATYRKMTLRKLAAEVTIDEDTPDPTVPSEP